MAIITGTNSRSNSRSSASLLLPLLLLLHILPPSSPPPCSVLSHKLRPLPTDRLSGVTCSISCLHLIRCSVILRRGACTATASRLFPTRLLFFLLRSSAARRPAAAFASHQSWCFFHVFFPSSFLLSSFPLPTFKYSRPLYSDDGFTNTWK